MSDAHEQVRNLLGRYCEAMDAADWDAVGELFAAGALLDGDGGEIARGAAAVASLYEVMVRLHDGSPRTRHLTSNVDRVAVREGDWRFTSGLPARSERRPVRAPRMRFAGKVALVTGAASGIGAATVALLRAEGATVVGVDVAAAEGVDHCDVRDRTQVQATVAGVVTEHGRLDVLANVAGVIRFGHVADLTPEEWQLQLDVNVTGPFHLVQAALPALLASRGSIVNVASVAGLKGQAYSAGYCASKGALVLLTRALAVELAGTGVRVNCVCPGTVMTPLILGVGEKMPPDVDPVLMARLNGVMSGLIEPAEVAASIAYLASDDARSVTGIALPIDLGVVA